MIDSRLVATIACLSHAQLDTVGPHSLPVTSGETTPENATSLSRALATYRIASATDDPAPSKIASTPPASYHSRATAEPMSAFCMWSAVTSSTGRPRTGPASSIASWAAATEPLPVMAE